METTLCAGTAAGRVAAPDACRRTWSLQCTAMAILEECIGLLAPIQTAKGQKSFHTSLLTRTEFLDARKRRNACGLRFQRMVRRITVA